MPFTISPGAAANLANAADAAQQQQAGNAPKVGGFFAQLGGNLLGTALGQNNPAPVAPLQAQGAQQDGNSGLYIAALFAGVLVIGVIAYIAIKK